MTIFAALGFIIALLLFVYAYKIDIQNNVDKDARLALIVFASLITIICTIVLISIL